MSELSFTLSRRRSLRTLVVVILAIDVVLIVLDGLINYAELVSSDALQRLFNIGREDSLPNFLSSVQELVVGAVLWLIWLAARRGPSRWVSRGWFTAAALFTYFGLDDGSRIHERVGSALGDSLSFFPSYTWQVVFVPLFGVAALVTLAVAWREIDLRSARRLLALAFSFYVVAVALDNLEGREDGNFYENLADDWGVDQYTVSHYARVIEEMLENLATTIFLVVFLYELIRRRSRITVAFGD